MEYFTITELNKQGDKLSPEVISNLTLLINNVLSPARKAFNAPIYINSGYRTEAYNKKINGAKNSQHCKGEAADITAGSKAKNKELFNILKTLPFDQLIDEKGLQWVHVSYNKSHNRGQILKL